MTAMVQQPGPAHMDPLNPPPSFSARKTASTNLPGRIELPSNPLTQKFGAPLATTSHNSQPSINSLLTPPSNISGDSLSPISSSSNSATNTGANGVPPYTPNGFWQPSGTGLTPYINSASGSTPPSWSSNVFPPPKNLFSPPLNSLLRNSNPSPPHTDGVQQPPYDLGGVPFQTSLSAPPTLPGMATTHQANMAYSQPGQSTISPQHTPLPAHDAYGQRVPPSPNTFYGSQSSASSQPGQYSGFSNTSPVPSNPQIPRMSLSPINQPGQPYSRPFQPYGMSAPMMPGVHSPGQQMQMVGMPGMVPTFHGHPSGMQHMYGHPGASPQNDRPFKCDQCPQSFNRNHDLKRHKRIHLAVKPFPCGHCEKSFSRKDALKRHILVKGCGKASNDGDKIHSDSADDKEESSEEEGPMQ